MSAKAFDCLFVSSMKTMFEGHPTMREQGLSFVDMIKELLQRLLEYRDVIHDENRENKMSCTVNLLVCHPQCQNAVRMIHSLILCRIFTMISDGERCTCGICTSCVIYTSSVITSRRLHTR